MEKLSALMLSVTIFLSSFFGAGGLNFERSAALAAHDFSRAGYALTELLIGKCYDPVTHTFNRKTDEKGMPYVWPAAAFVEAMADAYRLCPGSVRLRIAYADALKKGLSRYLTAQGALETPAGTFDGICYYNASAGNSGDYYYDDNEWVCIQLLLGYRNLGDASLLAAAEKNLDFLWTGWDDVAGGGIYWSAEYSSKNACSNAPGAIAFLLAYQMAGKEVYLARGRMIYDWMNQTMRERDLFCDSVMPDGSIGNRWKGAYNQATMIYAGSLLYEITGEERYYALTKATVDATLPHMFSETATAAGETVIRMNANPIFKAWCIGWLMRSYVKFYEVDPQKDSVPLEHCAAVLRCELATKDADGLYDPYFCSGAADPANDTDLLSQSGVACAFLNLAYYETMPKG